MKSYSADAMAAIEAGTAMVRGAVEIMCDPPIRVWGGYGNIQFNGVDFMGIGDRNIAITDGASIGGSAQNMNLSLSGIDPALIELLDADEVQAAPVVLWTVIFDGSGRNLLDVQPHRRGRVDQLPVEETAGGTATITAMVESAARGLGRRTGRLRSDADQRLLNPADGGCRFLSFAGQKTLYWGGKKPAVAGSAVGGASFNGGGGRGSNIRTVRQ